MKRFLTTCIMIAFVFGMFSVSVFAEEQVKQEEYSYVSDNYGDAKKLVEIPYGDSEETLGHRGGYGEQIPPKSFLIEENGDIYILDTLNDAIKKYSPDGTYQQMIPLPEGIYGLDIEKLGEYFFVYAEDETGSHKLYMMKENMPEIYWTVTGISTWDIAGLYKANEDLYIRSYNEKDKKLQLSESDTKEKRLSEQDAAPVCIHDEKTHLSWQKEKNTVERLSEKEGAETLHMTCRFDPLGAVYIGKMGNTEYVLTNETDWNYAETRITKFVDGVNVESALTISGKECIWGFAFKEIYIQNDIVYQMLPEENGIAIYQIPWTSSIQTRFSEEMIEEFEVEESAEKKQSVGKSATVNVSRDEAMERAYAMCGKGWYYDAATMHTPTTSTTKSPSYLGSTSKTVGGIPYCWGGMNGLDTATYSGSKFSYMQNFDDALKSGKTAGNIDSSIDQWTPGTFGIDCSGFIAAAFKIPEKVGTSTLAKDGEYFNKTDWSKVKAGDVAIKTGKGGHTFMIKYVYPKDAKNNYKMSTYESTTEGNIECAKLYERNSKDVINVYTLYSY